MESTRQLLLVYVGVIVINLLLSTVLWLRYRTQLHRSLVLVWASSIFSGLVQSVRTEDFLALVLGYAPTFLVALSLAGLLARVVGVSLRSASYNGALIAGLVIAVGAYKASAPFWVVALPVSFAVALPLLDVAARALFARAAPLTVTAKAAVLSCLGQGIHFVDFAFLRHREDMAPLGFSLALLAIFAVSITAPAVVLERVAEERAKVDEINRFQRRFFANISHDLRSPLTMILAPLESILAGHHGPLTPTQRSFLEANWRNGIRLLKLINDLLDLARIEEGFLRLRVEKADLAGLLADVVAFSRPLAARKGLTIDLDVRGIPEDVHLDVEKMERVFVNVLSNALKFTERGGITVVLDAGRGDVRVSIIDTGIGIAPEHLPHIFERFSQGDASVTRRFGGTGIGLAYAKEIVELHGGRITVESTPGKGSRFDLHLKEGVAHIPERVRDRRVSRSVQVDLKRGEDQEPQEWAQRLQRQKEYRFSEIGDVTDRRLVARGAPSRHAVRILVVEDNVDILDLVNLQLRDKYAVYVARNGRLGLELATRERPDLIITDFMMPEMDGLSLIRALRAEASTAEIPIIMLTARQQLEDRLAARDAGADVYLGKPFSPLELEAAVRQLLEKRGRHIQHVMRAHVQGLELMSAGLAHEIHNPLTFIKNAHHLIVENIGKLQDALARPDSSDAVRLAVLEKTKERLDRMVESAGRGVNRIEQVVELVRRYAREGYPTEPSNLPFDTAVKEVTDLVAPRGDAECEVSLALDAPGVAVRCIPEELHQVIRSLVQNAVDSVGAGGHVQVRTRAEGRHVLLEVTDDGPGISPENLGKIFSPFFTTKGGTGRGLGLPIVQIVVSRAGGSVDVSSVPGVETTFRVRLPAAESSERRLSSPAGQPPRAASGSPGLA